MEFAEGMKKCPHCAELIKSDAAVCRYCGRNVEAIGERYKRTMTTVKVAIIGVVLVSAFVYTMKGTQNDSVYFWMVRHPFAAYTIIETDPAMRPMLAFDPDMLKLMMSDPPPGTFAKTNTPNRDRVDVTPPPPPRPPPSQESTETSKDKTGDLEEGVAAYDRLDYATAMHILLPFAKIGNEIAQFDVGVMYEHGKGVDQSYADAENWFRKAANEGYPNAQVGLGFMYEHGNGVQQNYAEAVTWYLMAAEQGNAVAQFDVGVMYEHGTGVDQSYADAENWFRKAADQGYAKAQTALDHLWNADGNPGSLEGYSSRPFTGSMR
jgi:hypothetical protein